jgi:hypothetical protein
MGLVSKKMRAPKMMPVRPKPFVHPSGESVVGADRCRPVSVPVVRKPLEPPKGKGGELWQRFYTDAQKVGNPYPEKFADSALRSRERVHDLDDKRHKLQQTNKVPGRTETVAAAKPKGPTCKSRTLENRPCPFAATCGNFCKKHAPK